MSFSLGRRLQKKKISFPICVYSLTLVYWGNKVTMARLPKIFSVCMLVRAICCKKVICNNKKGHKFFFFNPEILIFSEIKILLFEKNIFYF